jgi:hypothetical protein
MLVMHWTFPGMGFGLGCMVEGCALFGMADCRSAPNPPYANSTSARNGRAGGSNDAGLSAELCTHRA